MDQNRQSRSAPNVVVSASLAYDYIMTFPGSFKDHILPDKVHVLSVSFLLDSLERRRGGIAGNIAYSLALLGEPAVVVGAGGPDFGEYRAAFEERGINMSHVLDVPDQLTGSAFMTADLDGNQINGFYPGASSVTGSISVLELARGATFGVVGATAPDAMRRHATEFAEAGCRLIYDPSQQVVVLPAEDLKAGIDAAWAVIGSDYEFAMIEQKTGLSVEAIDERVPMVVVTFGEQGSEIRYEGEVIKIPAVPANPLVEPTGGGDAYRAGLIKGWLLGLELPVAGRLASLTATYAIEQHGTQEHTFTPDAFVQRFDAAFPELSGVIGVEVLSY